MGLKNLVYLVIGLFFFTLGGIGVFLPILPTFPFLLVSAFCFARSSPRLHHWFLGTKLYQENLESFLQGKGMSRKAKVRLMISLTLVMAFGFIMMRAIPLGQLVLTIIWLAHIVYFSLIVKTRKQKEIVKR